MTSGPRHDEQYAREEEALARHREELRKRFPLPDLPKPAQRVRHKAAQALAILALVVGGLLWLDPAYRHEQLTSAVGERREVTLADGSRVTLDTATDLQISWHLRSRQVRLQRGQALFEVSPARYRPFLVEAGATRVRVVGTVFAVKNLGSDVQVSVTRGKVSVRGSQDFANEIFLTGGQQVLAHAGQLGAPTTVDAKTQLAWKDGKLIFARTPLKQALGEIQRYRQAPLRLMNEPLAEGQLADLEISGVFNTAQTDAFLDLLPSILPVKLIREANGAATIQAR
ncbi:iron dicitrate transport regulator FecR [Pseudomonas cavernae]|uniref:Iron dicitrate transport regulator FecR n=1 Tax=Pseudomonas cavernae TaxID=2320867 RepID=A0A385Z4J6_9PSED|nr:FecR domain-containing protein [Pseudomonas cavernae]AYC33664.1 iron dicitrate transport regulator FecR [Pseudomonas cavernae]